MANPNAEMDLLNPDEDSNKGKLPNYPADHKVGMHVPAGGSNCHKCEYVNGQNCRQKQFVQWNGSNRIPLPTNQYCCDFFEAKKGEDFRNKRK